MLFVIWLLGLLLYSAIGTYRLRNAGAERYAPFIYTCALWWASLPAITGDWVWALFSVPGGLVVAHIMVRRRAAEMEARTGTREEI